MGVLLHAFLHLHSSLLSFPMLKFKNKFKFGSAEKESVPSPLSPRHSSESRKTLVQSLPDVLKLTLSESHSDSLPSVASSTQREPSVDPQAAVMFLNPGLLTVKMYRSQKVVLPISIHNNKQLLRTLATNAHDVQTSTLLGSRLDKLVQAEAVSSERAAELMPGTVAPAYLPANIEVPSGLGDRLVKALLYVTMEFDNNMLLLEPRTGTLDASQWDRVVLFDVTKMLSAGQTASNFLNLSVFARLPYKLIPELERAARQDLYINGTNDMLVGQIKVPLNLRCHSKAVRLVDHEFLKFKRSFEGQHEDIGEILLSIDFRPLLKTSHLLIENFDLLKVIGKGSFGKVMQVMKKDTKQVYALKTLRKHHIISRMEVTHTLAERTVLARINNPFIVPLKFSFQSPEKLYLVLSFINGGELFHHLQQSGKFDMDRSRFYIAELLTALESLHELNVIYRDLKPENILLDYQGHIALCDFGLCKLNMANDDKTNTFCGTPEYLAPELLLNQGYTRSVDWWTLGTLLYEMLTGLPPFYDDDVPTMYKKILQNPLKFPPFLEGTDAHDLLVKLLQKEPSKRLDDAQQIKSHPFFKDIDWNKLLSKSYMPPFKPQVAGLLDTSNFDQDFTNERPQDSVVDDFLSASVQKQFGGWTYNGETVL